MFTWERRALTFVHKHIYWFAAGLVLLLSLYARYAFLPLVNKDIIAMRRWLVAAQTGGMTGLITKIDYSAIYCYLFYLLSKLRVPLNNMVLLKLMYVAFEYLCIGACSLMVYRFSTTHRARNTFVVFTLLCLSPVLVLNAAAWGQCDTMYTLCVVLALMALSQKRALWVMIWYGIALSLKLQAVFVFPALLLVWFLRRDKSFLLFLLLPLIVWVIGLPLVFFGGGRFYNLREYLSHATSQGLWATHNYPNFFALFGDILNPNVQPNSDVLLMFMKLGTAICLCVLVLMYVLLIRKNLQPDRETLVLLFAWTALAAVYFMPHMHERYGMMGEVLLLCYAELRNKPAFYLAWALSTIITVFSYSGFLLYSTLAPQQIGAFGNLAILLLLSRELLLAPGATEQPEQAGIAAQATTPAPATR